MIRTLTAPILIALVALATLVALSVQSARAADPPSTRAALTLADTPATIAPVPVPQAVPDPGTNLGGWVDTVYSAVKTGGWKTLIVALVIGLVALIRFGAAKLWSWFATDAGGALIALFGGIVTAVANAALAGALSWSTVWSGVVLGFTAAGGYSVLKRFLQPLLDKLWPPVPSSIAAKAK